MIVIGLLIFLGIPLLLIGFGYYFDFKRDKKYFLSGIKSIFKMSIVIAAMLVLFLLFSWLNGTLFPLDKDFGVNKNPARIELGIPIIETNWVEQPRMGNQYRKWYLSIDKDTLFQHKKKTIEFNFWSAILEEDYFESTSSSTKLITQYDYRLKKMNYFKIEPLPLNEQVVTNDEGKIFVNREAENKVEISKMEFEKMLEEHRNK